MERKSVATGANGAPVVGTDAIEILENDHRTIKGLLAQLTTGPESERKAVLERLKSVVVVHNATEENLVYPAIHVLAQRPMHADKLYHQQDESKVVVFRLSNLSPGDPEFQKKANDLRDAVSAHIEKEEQSEFRHLRDAAGAEMPKLTDDVRRFRSEFVFTRES
jgi:hemerythrin-like domain-containing protein